MPPDLEPPNLGEVLRRLDDLRSDVADLIAEMKADRAENAKIYVRADVYNERRKVQEQNVSDLHRDLGSIDRKIDAEKLRADAAIEKVRLEANAKFGVIESDRKTDMAWRRQVLLGLGTLAVTVLLAIVGFVITLTR